MFRIVSAFLFFALIINPISTRYATVLGQTSGSYTTFTEEGTASWYGPGFHGRKTASGERFDTNELTCAHKSLPFGTLLKVTNLSNDRYTIVKVNDRGPYAKGRIIDLSYAAKTEIGMGGLAPVRIEIYNPQNSEPNLEEDFSLMTIFEKSFTKTSKVIVQLNDMKPGSKNPSINSDDDFRKTLSNFKKVRIVLDQNNSIQNSLESDYTSDIINYIDLTSKVNTFNGYSIKVAETDSKEDAEELIGKLESMNLNDVFILEVIDESGINYKVFSGYFDKKNDASVELNSIKELYSDAKLIKVLS